MQIVQNKNILWDKLAQKILFFVAITCIIILFLIILFLFIKGKDLFIKGPDLYSYSIKDFVFGTQWNPTHDPKEFGTLPLTLASISVTLLASIIAIPLSMAIAIYLSEMATPFLKEIIKPAIEIISAIPSVVLGFFGLVVIAPWLQNTFDIDTGLNMFNAALMLAFMAIPTIASIAEDAISSVPQSLKNASYALGANKWQTIFFVTIPASLSGIFTAIILGISRVIGETMVVLMVAGGAKNLPTSIFSPIRPLTSNIAAEMAETSAFQDPHREALFAIGIILFVITMCFNLLANYLSDKFKFKSF